MAYDLLMILCRLTIFNAHSIRKTITIVSVHIRNPYSQGNGCHDFFTGFLRFSTKNSLFSAECLCKNLHLFSFSPKKKKPFLCHILTLIEILGNLLMMKSK